MRRSTFPYRARSIDAPDCKGLSPATTKDCPPPCMYRKASKATARRKRGASCASPRGDATIGLTSEQYAEFEALGSNPEDQEAYLLDLGAEPPVHSVSRFNGRTQRRIVPLAQSPVSRAGRTSKFRGQKLIVPPRGVSQRTRKFAAQYGL